MKFGQGITFVLIFALLVTWPVASIEAASLSGRSSTALEWYDTANEETATPAYQYLQLNVKDLLDSGYNFKFYGRLADDLSNEDDIDSRLYYAYLEKKDFFNNLDFRLGRQFISTTAGASMMDGLALKYSLTDAYNIRLFAGGDVKYYDGYNIKDVVDGIEFNGKFANNSIDLGISYLQKWDQGLIAKELLGFNIDYDLNDNLWLYNELQFDIISERLSYALLGGKYRFNKFTLRTEYLYSLPVFSTTSIYSVFAVEEYEELMAELTYKFSRDIQFFGRITHEMYEEFSDADVIEIGVEKLRTSGFYGYLTGTFRNDDDGQDLYGFKAYANYQFCTKFRGGLGANIDVLERDIAYFNTDDSDQNETTSTRIWVDGKYDLSATMNLTAKYEYIESDLWDYYNRGILRLNIKF
ncbi:hypothetical protein SAMN05660420_00225 [Desulfuromusa kysingii]|uniref:Beta-barrel porin 2 n=1 Tax=Desulfuromusa kysingii TaxID=37625 RepID=A0A1H3VQN0_9BACT|nr:hypothetical protein [Desulfuromusa kysingii]SDZ77107.1 hypothetical protein SAMN05660420_00225 [Desulfuromusa kysingii]